MAVANYVLRRGQRFVWRRLPCGEVVQIAPGTAEPNRARHLAGVVTAKCNIIIQAMGKKLMAAEAKGLFDRVVREETADLESRHLLLGKSTFRRCAICSGLQARNQRRLCR